MFIFKKFFKKKNSTIDVIDANNNVIKTQKENLKDIKTLEKSQYEEKIDKVLLSVAQLFEPFKDILIKTLPFTKKIIFLLDKLALFIGFLAKKTALFVPLIIKFIKTKIFKFTIFVILALFIFGVILSKTFSNSTYTQSLENAIYKASGYKTEINGSVKIQFVPSIGISINNVGFYKEDLSQNSNNYGISQINADTLYLKLKFFPLLLGKIVIKDIELYNFSLNFKPIVNFNTKNTINNQYQNIINNIENTLKYTALSPKNIIDNSNTNNNQELEIIQNQPTLLKTKNNRSGSFELLINSIINKVDLEIETLSTLHFSRGKINFLNSNNQRILILDNIHARLEKNYGNKTIITGDLLLNGISTSYLLTIKNSSNQSDFKLTSNFNTTTDSLIIEGTQDKQTKIYSGKIYSQDAILNIISKFIVPLEDNISNAQFKSDFKIDKSIFSLSNIDFNLNNSVFEGSLIWDYGINNYIKIDLNTNISNLDSQINYYNNHLKNNSNNSNLILSLNSVVLNWKNNNINLFKPDYYDINFTINNTKINNILVDKIQLNAFLTSDNQLYIHNLSLNNEYNTITALGKINLDDKNTNLMIKSSGQIQSIFQLMSFNEIAISLLDTISNNANEYNLTTKLTTDNTKNTINFNDINGNFGKKDINKAYLTIKTLDNTNESTLNLNLKTLDFDEISNIYDKHIKNQKYDQEQDINIFGIDKTQILKINLTSQTINYKSLILKNGNLEIEFNKEGFNIKNFEAFSEKFGSITASMYANINVKPAIIGNLNFNNFYINFENLSNVIFNKETIIGNVILNGKLKFSGDNFNNIFSHIDGNMDLTKEERLQFNQYNIDNILYLTLTKRTDKNKTIYLVNDISGKIDINDNMVLFDSVSMLFFDNKTEYRGSFKGSYNILNQDLQLSGSMDNTQNISKQTQFTLSGNINNPKTSTKNITLKIKNINKAQVSNEEVQQNIDSNYTQSNNESSTERYLNEDEDTKEKRNSIYEKLLEENLN